MNSKLMPIDYLIFIIYFTIVSAYGTWSQRQKKNPSANAKKFFLNEAVFPWPAICASLIVSKISLKEFKSQPS